MKSIFKRLDPLTFFTVLIFAASLSLMNFKDLSWSENSKSYLGFILFGLLLVVKLSAKKNS